tara:strand:+ start:118 stop:765 length:648 start_codon:yes stop_codon:yes gene_type:complete
MKKQLFLILVSIAFIHSGTRVVAGYGMSTASFEEDPEGVDINYSGALNFGVEQVSSTGGITGIEYVSRGFKMEQEESYYDWYYGDVTAKMEADFVVNYLGAYYLHNLSQSNVPGSISMMVGAEIGYFWEGEMSVTAEMSGGGYNYSDSYSSEIDGDDWEDMDGDMIDAGILVGASYNVNPQLSIRATYYYGLTEPNEDFITNWSTINVAAAYAIN